MRGPGASIDCPAPVVTLVAAVARGGVIGAGGAMPWHLPADFAHFKRLTMGLPMIMGRATFDSIGRALPGRRTIVVTRSRDWQATGVQVAHSLDQALALAASDGTSEVFVVGGGQIYAQALPVAHRMVLSHVDRDVAGDAYFPTWDPREWRVGGQTAYDGFTVITYDRVAASAAEAP